MCYGILTSWVSQASFDPPGLMLALPARELQSFGHLSPGTAFTLNILKEGRSVRRHFSERQATPIAFTSLSTCPAENGSLIIEGALAYLECTVKESVPVGEHRLIYARVSTGSLLETGGVTAIQR